MIESHKIFPLLTKTKRSGVSHFWNLLFLTKLILQWAKTQVLQKPPLAEEHSTVLCWKPFWASFLGFGSSSDQVYGNIKMGRCWLWYFLVLFSIKKNWICFGLLWRYIYIYQSDYQFGFRSVADRLELENCYTRYILDIASDTRSVNSLLQAGIVLYHGKRARVHVEHVSRVEKVPIHKTQQDHKKSLTWVCQ